MKQISQTQKIVQFLKANPLEKFTARDIAVAIIEKYPEDYAKKRKNPRFEDEKAFISQVVAEIGSQKKRLVSANKNIFWQDKPRPRIFWYDPAGQSSIEQTNLNSDVGNDESFDEHDLYPKLISYLKSEINLNCLRIDEKRSKNKRGPRGNHWLHPDVVAMQALDKEWDDLVRECVQNGEGQRVRLWSFEVKKDLKMSNLRESFFQAVSNSSWANEGYLVSTSIASNVEQELRMLSALHGIGVILLNPENPSESEVFLPSKARDLVDWQTVNRIVVENKDFKNYIELVSTYFQTGRVRNSDWN